jgi:hypothetical protein
VVHPELGDFVRVRDRRWLVEAIRELGDGLQTLTLPGIDDDALAEQTDIVWAAEIDAEVLKQDDWATLLGSAPEETRHFLRLSTHYHLEHGQRGRSEAAPGAVSGWHPTRRLPVAAAPKGPPAPAREPADRR